MKTLIGSYNNGLYEIDIINDKINSHTKLNDFDKVSYITKYYDSYAYIYQNNNEQFLYIDNNNIKLDYSATHIYYDEINKLLYISYYGSGLLQVLKKVNEIWSIIQEISYGSDSKIHFAKYINSINLVGVCDLGLNKFLLYKIEKDKLLLVDTYYFKNNEGPRHFINHETLPYIYVLNELKPSITILEYKNNILNLIDMIKLDEGDGSAIRLYDNMLYAAVRISNTISSFKVLKNGLLKFNQKVQTLGDHPRDFNIIHNGKYLLVANMNSSNLTLFKIDNNKLVLTDSNYKLDRGSVIY